MLPGPPPARTQQEKTASRCCLEASVVPKIPRQALPLRQALTPGLSQASTMLQPCPNAHWYPHPLSPQPCCEPHYVASLLWRCHTHLPPQIVSAGPHSSLRQPRCNLTLQMGAPRRRELGVSHSEKHGENRNLGPSELAGTAASSVAPSLSTTTAGLGGQGPQLQVRGQIQARTAPASPCPSASPVFVPRFSG